MNKKRSSLIFTVFMFLAVWLNTTVFVPNAAYALTITQQPADAVVYIGDRISLSVKASGGSKMSYQWYVSDNITGNNKIPGANASTYSPPTAVTGTYYYYCNVYATGSVVSTLKSETAAVVVKALPAITLQPTDIACYTGESAVLSVKATGSETLTYQWYRSTTKSANTAVIIPEAVNASYSAPTAVAGTTYYFCVVTNTDSAMTTAPARSVASSMVKVAVTKLSTTMPTITSQPSPIVVYTGSPAQLSISAVVSGTLSYQWYSSATNSTANATAIDGAIGSTYKVPSSTAGTVYYYCVVTNTAALSETYSVTSSVVPCTVKAVTVITAQPAGMTAYIGETATLSVAAAGSGTLSYQWYKNTSNSTTGGSKISGATGVSYSVPTSVTGTAYFYCEVTSRDSSYNGTIMTSKAISTTAQVSVFVSSVTPPVITMQPVSATVYLGTAKTLSVDASGTGTLTYQWYKNTENNVSTGTAISGAVSAAYSLTNSSAGTAYYYCSVKNTAETASGSESLTVTSSIASMCVQPLPAITLQPADVSLCSGDTRTLSVGASGSGTLSYQWYRNTVNKTGGVKLSGANGPSCTVKTSGLGTAYYYCIVTNTDSQITEPTKTAAVTSRLAAVVVVSADAAAPKITTQPANRTVLAGETATLSVSATAAGSLSYQWFSNTKQSAAGAALISGATDPTLSVPTAASGKVFYFCQVTNTDNSKTKKKTASVNSAFALVTVNATTPTVLKQPASVKLFAASSFSISVTANGCGKLSYQWYSSNKNENSSGTPIPGAVSATFKVPTEQAGSAYYYCVITNTATSSLGVLTGTAVSAVSTVAVYALPSISSQPADAVIDSGKSVTLSARVTGSGSKSYQWYCSTSKGSGGKVISGAKMADYKFITKASTATATTYFYCVMTVFDQSMSGNQKITLVSDVAAITVKAVNAVPPTLTSNPVSQNLKAGDTAVLTVIAQGSGTLSYQWYSNTKNTAAKATRLNGETGASLTIPASSAGTLYYYCVVTNTDNALSGIKTASATSSLAKIIVTNG